MDRDTIGIPHIAEGVRIVRRVLLERGNMAFYAGEWQVEEGSSPRIDTLEVRLIYSKGDQGPCWSEQKVMGVRSLFGLNTT